MGEEDREDKTSPSACLAADSAADAHSDLVRQREGSVMSITAWTGCTSGRWRRSPRRTPPRLPARGDREDRVTKGRGGESPDDH
jgi:hypothetical protein